MKCQFCHADLPDDEEYSHVCNTEENHALEQTSAIVETTPEGFIFETAPADTSSEIAASTIQGQTSDEHTRDEADADQGTPANVVGDQIVETTPEGLIFYTMQDDASTKQVSSSTLPDIGIEPTFSLTIPEELTTANIVEYQLVETTPEGLIFDTTANDSQITSTAEYQLVETTPEGLIIEYIPADITEKATSIKTNPEIVIVPENSIVETSSDTTSDATTTQRPDIATPIDNTTETTNNEASSATSATVTTGETTNNDLSNEETIIASVIVETTPEGFIVETTPEGFIVEQEQNTGAADSESPSEQAVLATVAPDELAQAAITTDNHQSEEQTIIASVIVETTPEGFIVEQEQSTSSADSEGPSEQTVLATVSPDELAQAAITTDNHQSEEQTIIAGVIVETTPEGFIVEQEQSTSSADNESPSEQTVLAAVSPDELAQAETPTDNHQSEEQTIIASVIVETTPEGFIVEQEQNSNSANTEGPSEQTVLAAISPDEHTQADITTDSHQSEEQTIIANVIVETTPEGFIVEQEQNATDTESPSEQAVLAAVSPDENTQIEYLLTPSVEEQTVLSRPSTNSAPTMVAASAILETTPEGAIVTARENNTASNITTESNATILATSDYQHTFIENSLTASIITEGQQAPRSDNPEGIAERNRIQLTDPKTEHLLAQELEPPTFTPFVRLQPVEARKQRSFSPRLVAALIVLIIILIALPLCCPDWATGASIGALIATCVALVLTIITIIRSATNTAIRSKTQWLKQYLGRTILIIALILYSGFGLFAQSTIHILQAHWLESQQHWSQAIAEYQAGGENSPHSDDVIRTTIEWAEAENTQHNYTSSINHLNDALVNVQPDNTTLTQRAQKDKIQTMIAQGNSYLSQHNYSAAISNYEGIKTLPYCKATCLQQSATMGSNAFYNLAQQDLDQRDYDGAAENFTTLLQDFKVIPNAAQVHNDMAQALFGRGKENLSLDCPKAVSDYQELAQSYGDTPEGEEASNALKEKQHITGHFTTTIPQSSSEVPVVVFVQGLNGNLSNTQIADLALAAPFSIVQADGTFTSPALPQGTYDLIWGVIDSNGLEISDIYYQNNLIDPYYVAQLGPLCSYDFGDITDSFTAVS